MKVFEIFMKNLKVSVHRNKAFTLAEVLITLGIIGIVAEMTIPVLVANSQEQAWHAAAKEAYSKASQAVEAMKSDNAGDVSYYVNNSGTFKAAYMKYFKLLQSSCWTNCVPAYKTLNKTSASMIFMDDGQFITADGMFYGINNCYAGNTAGINESSPAGCSPYVSISVDVNGINSGPNTFGKDLYMFDLIDNHLVPMGGEDTEFPASKYCVKGTSSIFQGFGCMYYVMQGISYSY